MDWTLIGTIISAIAGSGAITAVLGRKQTKRMNEISAKSADADYTAKILEQSDRRVEQALADKDETRKEMVNLREDKSDLSRQLKEARDATKEERKKKQGYREEAYTAQLRIKELEADLREAGWHRCEVMACQNRIPPREEK